jgi:hypothetical protein
MRNVIVDFRFTALITGYAFLCGVIKINNPNQTVNIKQR